MGISREVSAQEHLAKDHRKAVFLCALQLEAKAVLEFLEDVQEFESQNFVWLRGRFEGRAVWEVTVAEVGPGNTPIAEAVVEASHSISPDVIVMVGIAGALKDVTQGDVVASSKAYNVHAGKASDQFRPRPAMESPSHILEQRARNVALLEKWKKRVDPLRFPSVTNAKAKVEPIASTEQVVAHIEATTYGIIKEFYSDSICVEMEGYGFLSGARRFGIPGIVVRGISDCCHDKSEDNDTDWQPCAATHAAAFAFEMLSNFLPTTPILHRPSKSESNSLFVSDQRVDAPKSNASLPDAQKEIDGIISKLATPGRFFTTKSLSAKDWIPREAEAQLQRAIKQNDDSRLHCIVGQPGSGKTAILGQFVSTCQKSQIATLAIKADLTPLVASFEESLRKNMDLHIPLMDAIKKVASNQPIIIVIDQLDALASLVDLTSDRLNEVISFIHKCLRIENTWIICSCREFEYSHDVRFTSINPKLLRLDLPEWSQVTTYLRDHGVAESEHWPKEFREILRSPQCLSVFLKLYRDEDHAETYLSYQLMLDELWNRLIDTPNKKHLVGRLCEYLTNHESLWAPLAEFEGHESAMEELIATEVLTREKFRVAFRHQTLLEHARARMFAKSDMSFCNFIIERQDAILVRPTIWSVLTYLRGADPGRYDTELQSLFARELRLHVRYLLIDFMGQHLEPRDSEVALMANRLRDEEDQKRVLIAIKGNQGWFEAFKSTQFPSVMRWPLNTAWPMIGVLSDAFDFAKSDCVELIRNHWLADKSFDEYTGRTLLDLKGWDDDTVDIVCVLAKRASPDTTWLIEMLAGQISVELPEVAPKVVAADLWRRLENDTRSPLDRRNDWHDITAIAEAAPVEFFRETWKWFIAVATRFHAQDASKVVNAFDGYDSVFDRDEELRGVVADAFRESLLVAAKDAPEEFLDITKSDWTVANSLVQKAITLGLEEVSQHDPTTCLEYVTGDPRRMNLSSYYLGEQAYSLRLIVALSQHLDDEGIEFLVNAIQSWSYYRPVQQLCESQKETQEKARLRLLSAIPHEKLPQEMADRVLREYQTFPNWLKKRSVRQRGGWVKEIPKLTKEDMIESSTIEIVAAMTEPEEEFSHSVWSEEDEQLVRPGGSESVIKEFCEFVKTDLVRLLPTIRELRTNDHFKAIGRIISGISELDLNDDIVAQLVEEMATISEPPEELRSNVSYLLYRHCKEETGLPEAACQLLDDWLGMPWDSSYQVFVDSEHETEKIPDQSILGYSEGGLIDSDLSFWSLEALTHGYLMRNPAATDKWLDLLEKHVERDISPLTWESFCNDLRWISLRDIDKPRAEQILARIFERFTTVATSDMAVRLIGMTSGQLSEEFLTNFIDTNWSLKSAWGGQAVGELLTLIALRDTHHMWAPALLDDYFRRADLADEVIGEQFKVGVTYCSSQSWEEPTVRDQVLELLKRTTEHCTERIAKAFGTIFWASEDLTDDEESTQLLQIIVERPEVLYPDAVPSISSHLEKLCRFQHRLVCDVVKTIVSQCTSDLGSMSRMAYGASPHLVNIAMTLQRFEDTRSEGLQILEDLMRLGIGEAFAILNDIDIRPVSVRRREPPPRRRRKPRAKK